MTILVTICLTCFGLLCLGVVPLMLDDSNNPTSADNLYAKTILWLAVAVTVITFISIITIGIYTGDIKEWMG